MNVPGRIHLVAPPVESLPYPAVSPFLLRAVEDALVEAWRRLLARTADLGLLSMAHEDDVTNPLVDELVRMRGVGFGAFRSDFFAAVAKSEELKDYTGTEVQKRDIILRLVPDPALVLEERYYGVFVEAKIINLPKRRTVELYRDEGLARFRDGRYAWKMREAVLVAYVLDGSALAATLPPALATPLTPRAWPVPSGAEVVSTRHDRAWSYCTPNQGSPGPIALSHVWLRPA